MNQTEIKQLITDIAIKLSIKEDWIITDIGICPTKEFIKKIVDFFGIKITFNEKDDILCGKIELKGYDFYEDHIEPATDKEIKDNQFYSFLISAFYKFFDFSEENLKKAGKI